MDCLFCKIINGDIPSKTVYEEDLVKVFLDINPTTNGDMLIVPKKHYDNFRELDDSLILHINKVAKDMYNLLKDKLNIDGITLVQNNGYGQEIKHYHLHLTPRYINDEVRSVSNKDLLLDIEEIFKKIS